MREPKGGIRVTDRTVVIDQPADGVQIPACSLAVVQVRGQAADKGLPEPAAIVSITVQVDDGPAGEAVRTPVAGKDLSKVGFAKTVAIPDVLGPHVITVTATNDQHLSTVATVTVFVGGPYQTAPASALAEVAVPAGLLKYVTPAVVSKVTQDVQHLLSSASAYLAGYGLTLAGPNAVADLSAGTLRVGLWAGAADFPAVPADPPDFPLPRLSDAQAAACFAATPPVLPAGDGFALSVPAPTLQQVLNALSPQIVAAGERHDFTIQTWTVATVPPATVSVEVAGNVVGLSARATISETLGLKPAAGTGQQIPAILATAHSASNGDLLEWLIPVLNLVLEYIHLDLSSDAGNDASKATGIIAPLLSLIPYDIPFRNTDLSASGSLSEQFPVLRLDWRQFGVTGAGLVGAGALFLESRTQDEVALTLDELHTRITGTPESLGADVPAGFTFTLRELDPDDGTFGWQFSGPVTTSGTIDASPFIQTGAVGAYLRLPLSVADGTYDYTLTVSATETCGTDPAETLTASWSSPVTVTVKPSSVLPPGPRPSAPAPIMP